MLHVLLLQTIQLHMYIHVQCTCILASDLQIWLGLELEGEGGGGGGGGGVPGRSPNSNQCIYILSKAIPFMSPASTCHSLAGVHNVTVSLNINSKVG